MKWKKGLEGERVLFLGLGSLDEEFGVILLKRRRIKECDIFFEGLVWLSGNFRKKRR